MVNATYYFESPITPNKKRNFFENLYKNDERGHIENINSLVSKLSLAKERLSKDADRWKVHCREFHFPLFTFNIETENGLWAASKELFRTTYPLSPLFVESDKQGYFIINRFLEDEFGGNLERRFFPLFTGIKKIVLPETYHGLTQAHS